MDFFEHQHQAKKKTKTLVMFFMLAVFLITAAINVSIFFLGNHFGQFQLSPKQWFYSPWFLAASLGTLSIILIGSLIRAFQVRGGGQAVAKMVKARLISMSSKDPLERRLINVVEEMSIASGMPVPSLYIMDDEMGMNAFVAGLVPSDTVLVVTKGLLEKLDRQELQGVVAHEFSHIFNADMRLNVRLIAILGGILAIGQLGYFLLRSFRYSGGRRRRSSSSSSGSNSNQLVAIMLGSAIALLVIGYIGLFFGRLIKAAISRQREFLADASAVQYSRDSMGIANALYKIKTNGKGSLLDSSHAEDMSHMCFGSALKFSAFSGMLATHPPIDERIKTLVPGYRSKSGSRANKKSNQQKASQSSEASSVHSSFASESSVETHSPDLKISNVVKKSNISDDALVITKNSVVDLVNQIGTINPEHLAQASSLFQSIPEKLITAAHDQATADLLILTIIINCSEQPLAELLSLIKKRVTEQQCQQITTLVRDVKQLTDEQVLPLIELTLPVLKQSESSQKKNLLACASLLMTADKKIIAFEFFLYALLRKSLSQKDASFTDKTYKKFKPLLKDIEYVLWLLSHAAISSNDQDGLTSQTHASQVKSSQAKLVAQAMKSFDANWKISDNMQHFNAKQFDASLKRLNQLTPLLKRPLMQTLAEVVMLDGRVNHAEIELIRSVGIYLECPVPLLTGH